MNVDELANQTLVEQNERIEVLERHLGQAHEAITKLTRELDRRGKVIEIAQIWRNYQGPPFDDVDRRVVERNLRSVVDEYMRETLRQNQS